MTAGVSASTSTRISSSAKPSAKPSAPEASESTEKPASETPKTGTMEAAAKEIKQPAASQDAKRGAESIGEAKSKSTSDSAAAPERADSEKSKASVDSKATAKAEAKAKVKVSANGEATSEAKPAERKGYRAQVTERALESSRNAVGRETSNDGMADSITDRSFVGTRDRKIRHLEREGRVLDRQIEEIQSEVDNLETKVSKKDKRAEIVDLASKVAMPGVGLTNSIAGLFDKSFNPGKDIADRVQRTGQDREVLEAQLKSLTTKRDENDERISTLKNEQILNLVTDAAHTTNMGAGIAQLLDGQGDVEIVVDKDYDASDAAYDTKSGKIIVGKDLQEQLYTNLQDLIKRGICDENGNILDAHKFVETKQGRDVVGAASLIGPHETTHLEQHRSGSLESLAHVAVDIASKQLDTNNLPAEIDTELVAAAADLHLRTNASAEAIYYGLTEYDSYLRQDAIDLQSGRQRQVMLGTNEDGSLLSKAEAFENTVMFYAGKPIPYGMYAGKVAEAGGYGSLTGDVDSSDETLPGRTRRMGEELSGEQLPGRTRRMGEALSGEQLPGRTRRMGETLAGEQLPGRTRRMGELLNGETLPGRTRRM